jgi:tRNA A37 methylthiotransferase MiaB
MIGKTASIMVTESGKNGTVVGRDNSYRPVVISGNFGKYARLEVEIVDSAGTYLIGRPLAS